MIKNRPNQEDIENKINEQRESLFGGNRQETLIRDKFQCQKCGMNQMQHIVIYGNQLCVHHIDNQGRRVKRGHKNNDLDNLITLCCSCHSKIHRNKIKPIIAPNL